MGGVVYNFYIFIVLGDGILIVFIMFYVLCLLVLIS